MSPEIASPAVSVMSAAISEPTKQFLAGGHFLRTETQAARAAVDSLDKYSIKLVSFEDKGIELLEEAHRWACQIDWLCREENQCLWLGHFHVLRFTLAVVEMPWAFVGKGWQCFVW